MSDSSKAVFLSYASQDAEAARRICESLRAGGVEVWCDVEGGLEHGDEWDAKIRRQIKECVLFIPLISGTTQARHEGYFRIEWELAAQRAMGIASGVAFILPVVIDTTREPDALVPDRFRAVQWTRLAGGVVTPEVQTRFLKLWSHRAGVVKHAELEAGRPRPASRDEGVASPARRATPDGSRRVPAAAWGVAGAVVAVALAVGGYFWAKQPTESAPISAQHAGAGTRPPTTERAAAPLSEARQLVAKVWELLNKPEMARPELDAADVLCKRAAALDPTDAEVWAAWASMNTWYVFHNLDGSAQRQEAARDAASRAMQLAPNSFEARLAQALFWVRGMWPRARQIEAQRLLRELLRERPDEPRALFSLGFLLTDAAATVAESNQLLERMAKNPAFAAVALDEIGWTAFFAGDFAMAEAAADRSLAAQPYWNNLALKITLAERVHGDLARAKSALDQMPASALQEDVGIGFACGVYQWRREPLRAIEVLEVVPRDWIRYFFNDCPKAFLLGEARLMAKQVSAARRDFQRALDLLEKRLIDDPNNGPLLGLKALALHHLGEREAAHKTYRLVKELGGHERLQVVFESSATAIAYLKAKIAEPYWSNASRVEYTAASLRLDPYFDPLRAEPGFQALVAQAEIREKTEGKK